MTISPKQARAAQLLATGMSNVDACKELGINAATLVRWRKLASFNTYYIDLLSDVEQETMLTLRSLRRRAVEKVGALLDCGTASIEIRAASTILEITAPISINESIDRDSEDLVNEAFAQAEASMRHSLGMASE